MRPRVRSVLLAGLVLICAACQSKTETPNGVYDIRGAVVALDSAKKTVELDHEEIPGVMPAMSMEYSVVDPKVLQGLNLGDSVRGKVKVESGNYSITSLVKR